jgi:hypothetical protein
VKDAKRAVNGKLESDADGQNKVKGGDHDAHHSHHRVGYIVRRGRRLLLEETAVDVTSHIILTQKQNLIKEKGGESI